MAQDPFLIFLGALISTGAVQLHNARLRAERGLDGPLPAQPRRIPAIN